MLKRARHKLHSLLFVPILLLGLASGVFGQASEVEILGPAKTPFVLKIADTSYASTRSHRVVTEPISSGTTVLHIQFHDARFPDMYDTLTLIPGIRHILRLKKVPLENSDSANHLGLYLRKKWFWVARNEPSVVVLVPFETITASEKALSIITNTSVDTIPQVTHTQSMVFTRDTLYRAAASKQVKGDTIGAPVKESALETDLTAEQVVQLKTRMKDLTFEEDKIKLTHTILGQKKLSVNQLYEILILFDFERSKMQLFKHYFHQLTDRSDLTRVFQAFEFSSTIEELKTWVYEQSK